MASKLSAGENTAPGDIQPNLDLAMHKAKDGREVWLSSTYVPITTDDGKTTEIPIFSHDVTAEVAQ